MREARSAETVQMGRKVGRGLPVGVRERGLARVSYSHERPKELTVEFGHPSVSRWLGGRVVSEELHRESGIQ